MTFGPVHAFGQRGLLVEVTDPVAARDLALWARGRHLAEEVVPAAATVLLDGIADPDRARAALDEWQPGTTEPDGDVVELAVNYDGPDLATVAELWELTTEEVITRHTSAVHVVAFCGFAPGFAYLTNDLGLPDVPRLASPRPRVEPGSVGLAGGFTGTYPSASPGGWQLIGRTDAVLWDAERPQPALLAPGTRVRFVAR